LRRASILITVPLGVLALGFALGTRDTVTIAFWPLPFQLELPAFVAILAAAAVGFLACAVPFSAKAWALRRRVERLERALAECRATQSAAGFPSGRRDIRSAEDIE
jgi:lipopolysaccharide assembly protein A